MAENDIGDWFRSIPIISRWWFSLTVIFPLAGRIGLLNPFYMILNFDLVFKHFQVSRYYFSLSVGMDTMQNMTLTRPKYSCILGKAYVIKCDRYFPWYFPSQMERWIELEMERCRITVGSGSKEMERWIEYVQRCSIRKWAWHTFEILRALHRWIVIQ